ncbi:hypothetical protein K1719_022224 [Acacia pycnantha]|nr:hypothetical protein K1719_022224 [Acacia pycnantha]
MKVGRRNILKAYSEASKYQSGSNHGRLTSHTCALTMKKNPSSSDSSLFSLVTAHCSGHSSPKSKAMEARPIPGIVVIAASSLLFLGLLAYLADARDSRSTSIITNITLSTHRKLFGGSEKKEAINRIWGEEKCRKEDIVIRQGATAPLASGVPTYTVEVTNMCGNGGCDISGIHISCRWFSSARLINPKVFKRLRYNDCLLNDGKALAVGATLSFQYANTFPYPLSVSSVSCPP